MLVGLTGYAGAGKDEIGKILITKGFHRLAFADKVRDCLYALNPYVPILKGEVDPGPLIVGKKRRQTVLFRRVAEIVDDLGWDDAKQNPEIRVLLQRMGTDVGRKIIGPDVWVHALQRDFDSHQDIVVTDVRFPNEAEVIDNSGGYVWRVDRPGVGPANDHESERYIPEIPVEYVVENSGTLEDLKDRVMAGFV